MNATIRYRLTETGRKADILAGGTGVTVQEITLTRNDPLFATVVEAGKVQEKTVLLDTADHDSDLRPQRKSWDTVPTACQILWDYGHRKQACADEQEARAARVREDTQATLDGRVTKDGSSWTHGHYVHYPAPDWPWPRCEEVVESPAALAWIAELDIQRERALAADEAEWCQFNAAEDANKLIAAEAEQIRRTELGMRPGDEDYAIENGAMIGCPCWESHKRGKNWMASIRPNPSAPGGLDRTFFDKAKVDFQLIIGEALEFRADYYSGSGTKTTTRHYAYVVSVSANRLVLHQCATGKAAIKQGREHAASLASM